MDRMDEMKLALHRWTGAGFQDIHTEKTLGSDSTVAFNVHIRGARPSERAKRYIVATKEVWETIMAEQSQGKAEYNKEYLVEGLKGVLQTGLEGYIILWVTG